MRSYKNILLGLVIGFLLVFAFGAAYDRTYITHSPIYEDTYGPYLGSSSDSQMSWNASGYVDWNVTGDVDMDLTGKFTMDFSAATDSSGGFKVTTNVPTGQQLYGGFYSKVVIEGTTDGPVGAIRGRVDVSSASTPVGIVQGARITVEESTGADLTDAEIVGLNIETYLVAGGADPVLHHMMRFNTSQGAETPDGWFHAANPESIAWTRSAATGSGTKTGAIKITISGTPEDSHYIRTYDAYN